MKIELDTQKQQKTAPADVQLLRARINNLEYKISRLINASVDTTTGEIDNEKFAEVEKLAETKEELAQGLALNYKGWLDLINSIKAKEADLRQLKTIYQKSADSVKEFLEKHVEEDQIIETDSFRIFWRNNPPSVLTDDLLRLDGGLHVAFPELVKEEITYKLDKMKVKAYAKAGTPLPEGIRVVQRKSLVIK